MPQTYCTAANVYFVLSEANATACVDDGETGQLSTEGEGWIDDAIEIAAGDINQKVTYQYKLTDLAAGNYWLKWTNAYLAAGRLATRRNNAMPESLAVEIKRREDLLELIRWGRGRIPEQAPSFDHTPSVSNFRPELYKRANPIRVDTEESTGNDPPSDVMRKTAGDFSSY